MDINLEQQTRFFSPHTFLTDDYHAVYKDNKLTIGTTNMHVDSARKASAIVVGAQFGDEGKGAMIDRKIEQLLSIKGVEKVYVIRYQGGSNAGHTVYTPEGKKVPLHQVPSSIMYKKTVGIMDSGMIINLEDLKTEIEDAEEIVGSLKQRLILSPEAMLATDLERAEELLNRFLSSGNADGGTGRGISPAVAGRISRTGSSVGDLFAENWKEHFARKYDLLAQTIKSHKDFPFKLSEMEVPDLKGIRTGTNPKVKIGTKTEFLRKLKNVRTWFIKRKMIQDTFALLHSSFNDLSVGILFEGSQAIGLHPFLGRYPDVTATDTTAYGVNTTQVYRMGDIDQKIGVFKLTYQSSVGSAVMITSIDLPRSALTPEQEKKLDEDQKYGAWVREVAHERGTTTGRYRDICFLDLEQMRYNCRMGGIQMLAATHLDIAQENTDIKVCTHYINSKGERVPFQPGIKHQEGLTPQYIKLPGWSMEAAQNAKSFDELPINAQRFLAYVQRSVGVPIVLATNGPERHHMIEFKA